MKKRFGKLKINLYICNIKFCVMGCCNIKKKYEEYGVRTARFREISFAEDMYEAVYQYLAENKVKITDKDMSLYNINV